MRLQVTFDVNMPDEVAEQLLESLYNFSNELMELGYQDAMWERAAIERFFSKSKAIETS